MYDVRAYGMMIEDSARVECYSRALSRTIVPQSSVVLDIGAGTGIVTSLACRHGARKVFAIEPDNIIILAREAARAGGYADRVEFIQGLSTGVDLLEEI